MGESTVPPIASGGPGGMLACEFTDSSSGERHPLRFYVAPFTPTPTSPHHDYLYTGGGSSPPAETGVLETFAALGRVWKAYYPSSWSLALVAVAYNQDGVLTILPTVPGASPVTGTAAATLPAGVSVRRQFTLRSAEDERFQFWLWQMPGTQVDIGNAVTPAVGGIDARDRAMMAYLAGPDTAIRSERGRPWGPHGSVKIWWSERRAAPLLGEEGTRDQFIAPVPPDLPQDGWLWVDTGAPLGTKGKGIALNFVVDTDTLTPTLAPADVSALQAAGARVARVDLHLGAQTAWSPAVVAAYRTAVDALTAAGIRVVGLLGAGIVHGAVQADWNAQNLENGGSGSNAFLDAYALAAQAVVSAFPQIDTWELWNEPNVWTSHTGSVYSGGSYIYPSLYAALLRSTYGPLKALRPAGAILSGGLLAQNNGGVLTAETSGAAYLAAVYAACGSERPFDGVGLHLYLDQGGDLVAEHVRAVLDLYAAAFAAAADTGRSLYVTECGWTTHAVSEDVQAANLSSLYGLLVADGTVPLVLWFQIRDNPGGSQFYGLCNPDGSHKTSFAAFAAVQGPLAAPQACYPLYAWSAALGAWLPVGCAGDAPVAPGPRGAVGEPGPPVPSGSGLPEGRPGDILVYGPGGWFTLPHRDPGDVLQEVSEGPYVMPQWGTAPEAGFLTGDLVADCLTFPLGATICNTPAGEVHVRTPSGEHVLDLTGISIPGGHRLEVAPA